MASFYVENFGCRATQADGAAIEEQFRQLGYVAGRREIAQFVVLNTCAVTASAERDARTAIRRLRRENPECRVIVTGCYAQRAPREIAALPGVSVVVGNSHKQNLAQIAVSAHSEKDSVGTKTFIPVAELSASLTCAAGNSEDRSIFVSDIFAHTELLAAPVFDSANERTRPNLKVQDGCNNRCSFCIIPSLRGRSRSLRMDEVLRQVNDLVASGYREVVISGINLGRWGRDLPETAWGGHSCRPNKVWGDGRPRPSKLEDLVRAILDETSLEKVRISSVEPMDWTDSLIRLMAESPRIAKHAHVPMQSGSDTVLRRMHRKYRPWHYREKIENIRTAMPSAAIGADVMVGFPGETGSEFEETRRMIEDLPLTYLHVFTFSARPGTPAASMCDQVPSRVAHERNRILRELATGKKRRFMQSFVGQNLYAITLSTVSEDANGTSTDALTENYLQLKLRGNHNPNEWLNARINSVRDNRLIGELATDGSDVINFASIRSQSQSHTYAD